MFFPSVSVKVGLEGLADGEIGWKNKLMAGTEDTYIRVKSDIKEKYLYA